MNRSTRFISRLLVLTMILGLFAAFPVLNAAAADTNYAKGLTATVTKGTEAATPAGGVVSALTDGVFPTAEGATDSVWYSGTGTLYAFTFDLGSTKTDLASVYAYVRYTEPTGNNRGFDTRAAKVEVSNDNVTYTSVSGTTSFVANANADYYDFQYNFSAVASGRYVRVTLASTKWILSLAEIEIRNYGLSSGGSASEATDDPTLVDGNYAYGATYTVTQNDGEPAYRGENSPQWVDGGNWLTDGYEGATPTANGSAYYTVAYAGTGANYVFTLNLTASKSDIGSVTLVNVPAPGESFKDPTNVAISTSTDGLTYSSVGTLQTTSIEKNAGGAYDLTYAFSAKSGKYVQISLTSPGFLLGFDEIVIKGAGGAIVDPDPNPPVSSDVVTSSTATNYALASKGAYYKYSAAPHADYVDDTWSRPSGVVGKFGQGQLNDGKYAAGSYNDTEWVAWQGTGATYEITFDLAHLYGDIDQIAFTTLAHGGDVEGYEVVNSISVAFGDINGNFGAATTVNSTVTETAVTAADGKTATYYRSQFGIKGAATGVRYVKIAITTATFRLFIDEIEILGATGFEGVDAPSTDDSSTTSTPSTSEDDGSYVLDRDFKVDVSAAYGEFDTDKDGTNDFTGIAVDVYVNDITYDRGLLGIEGFLNFDNTKLQPLYVTDADLNGTGLDVPPKTILNWPTFTLIGMNLYAIEGLCQAYSMADGSTTDPANPEATFSKTDSRMRIRYILHTDYYEGYTNGTSIGVKEDGAMALRYYFIVPEGSEGETFTFTVPDTPKATHISECALYAPMSYLDGTTIKYSSVYGYGGSASVTIEEPAKEYTVTFVGKDGETLKTETVVEGGAATAPEAPAVDGFEFKGWDKAFDNITGDLTVTAIYEEIVVSADFFTFADGADNTYVTIDDTNGYLKFAAGGMTVANVQALFVDTDITFTKASGAAQTSGNVGTGTTITSTINGESKSYIVVVLGDVTGDGKINSGDAAKVKAVVAGKATFEGAIYVAANVAAPGSAKINSGDVSLIKAFAQGRRTSF